MIAYIFSRVPEQNGISRLYNMLEIYHSCPEPIYNLVFSREVRQVVMSRWRFIHMKQRTVLTYIFDQSVFIGY